MWCSPVYFLRVNEKSFPVVCDWPSKSVTPALFTKVPTDSPAHALEDIDLEIQEGEFVALSEEAYLATKLTEGLMLQVGQVLSAAVRRILTKTSAGKRPP